MERNNEVIVQWNDPASITKGERKKARLENAGLSPIKTVSTIDGAVITYGRAPAGNEHTACVFGDGGGFPFG